MVEAYFEKKNEWFLWCGRFGKLNAKCWKHLIFLLNVKNWILNGFKKKLWVVCDVVDLESSMQNVKIFALFGKW